MEAAYSSMSLNSNRMQGEMAKNYLKLQKEKEENKVVKMFQNEKGIVRKATIKKGRS